MFKLLIITVVRPKTIYFSDLHNRQCYLVLLVYIVNKEFKEDLATYDIGDV